MQGYASASGATIVQGCRADRHRRARRAGSPASRRRAGGSRPTPSSAAPGSGRARSARSPASSFPVEGEARSMWFTPEDGGLPERLPLTIDFSTGFYFHREGPGLAFGGRERALEDVAEAAARRLPVLVELPVQTSWWGWYDVSPDWNALVGEIGGAVAVPLRDRLLRPRLPAGAGGRRAPRRARDRPAADARPLRVRRRALRARARRGPRRSWSSSARSAASGGGRTCLRHGTAPTSTSACSSGGAGTSASRSTTRAPPPRAADAPSLFATYQIDCMP